MIYTHALVALIAAVLAAGSAWTVRGWKADAAQAAIVEGLHAAVAAQRAQVDAAAERFEVERAKLARSRRAITNEVNRVVETPHYSRDAACLDDDGLRIVNAAIAGADTPGQPAPAMPAASAAE